MDLYLCGTKGLAALKIAVNFSQFIDAIFVIPDNGVYDDPYENICEIARKHNLIISVEDFGPKSSSALAVGWKYIINGIYTDIYVIHDSLLPKYRGWNPLVSALQNGDMEIGATLFLAKEKFDQGPIIRQEVHVIEYPVRINEAMRLIDVSISNLTAFLFENFDSAKSNTTPQDESQVTYSIWRDEDDYLIDWSKPSGEVIRFINSVSYPYRGALSTVNGNRVRVWEVAVSEDLPIVNRVPGKVWGFNGENPIVLCGQGSLEIKKISYEDESDFKLSKLKTRFI